jgi:hypothetical protein
MRLMTLLAIVGSFCLPQSVAAQYEVFVYKGRCDASAGAALDADHFIVGNDERNTLRIYKHGQADPVGATVDLSIFLGTKIDKESDIEASATIGNRIYWISSHANKKKTAEFQERRHRFFATDIKPGNPPSVTIPSDTKHYARLRENLIADDRFKPFKLEEAAKLAPEAPGGFNIEGLAATPDGKLLIGFRNPIPAGGALIVPLENPDEMLRGKLAKFGNPILLKGLSGNGIRSIELVGSSYLVISGPPDEKGSFALHRWSGKPDEPATQIAVDFKGLRPEALFVVAPGTIQILSDDGDVTTDGKECKDLDEAKQTFRSITIKP